MRASVAPMQTIKVPMVSDTARACAANRDLLYDASGASWPASSPAHGELGRPIKHERSRSIASSTGGFARLILSLLGRLPVYLDSFLASC